MWYVVVDGLFEEVVHAFGRRVPVANREDLALVEFDDRDFALLLREAGDEFCIVAEDDTVLVFAHFGEGEHAADGGHALDVGEVDRLLPGQVILAEGGKGTVGLFAGVHVMADEQEAGIRGGEGVGLIMLILGAERLDRVTDRVGVGGCC